MGMERVRMGKMVGGGAAFSLGEGLAGESEPTKREPSL